MANQPQPNKDGAGKNPGDGRFEYRVWGKHKKARRRLAELADEEIRERVDDCYLLTDDPSWNAKVRDDTLKLKHLVAEDKGFEHWASGTYRSSDDTPSPFDDLYEELDLDRVRSKKPYNLKQAVESLDPKSGIRAVFVSKQRRRYRIGDIRAEVTDVKVKETGEKLTTLVIEGDNLKDLVALRKQLGLKGEPNTPVHLAIDDEAE